MANSSTPYAFLGPYDLTDYATLLVRVGGAGSSYSGSSLCMGYATALPETNSTSNPFDDRMVITRTSNNIETFISDISSASGSKYIVIGGANYTYVTYVYTIELQQ